MKITNNIWLQELVPSAIFQSWGNRAIMFIDPVVPLFAQKIRDRYGKPMIINNWHTGGTFQLRGFRPPASTVGGLLSQHRFGRAIDFHIPGVPVQEIYKDILDNQATWRAEQLTTLENISHTPTWIHADCRWHAGPGILVVNP
jgi:hypothetical protein